MEVEDIEIMQWMDILDTLDGTSTEDDDEL